MGFFYVENHGVDAALMDAAFAAARELFALPEAAKQALRATPASNNRGWTPLGEETLDPARQSRGDTKEGFYIGREVPADAPEAALPLHGARRSCCTSAAAQPRSCCTSAAAQPRVP